MSTIMGQIPGSESRKGRPNNPSDHFSPATSETNSTATPKIPPAGTALIHGNEPVLPKMKADDGDNIQAKLRIGGADDAYEKEADAVADRVMRMPSSPGLQMKPGTAEPGIQMKCAKCEEEEEKLQMKPAAEGILQMKPGNDGQAASEGLSARLNHSKSSGQLLPEKVSHEMGGKIGADFSGVKVHTGSDAIQMSREIGAQAFTHGSDIYFNKGKYNPGSQEGKHLLAHELTHVIQQQSGAMSIQRKCDADDAVEWYKTTESGKKIIWTNGLVQELYKVVGTAGKAMYTRAIAEGKIGPAFVALVCQAQVVLGFTGDDVDGKIGVNTIAAWSKWKTGGDKGINYTRLFKDKKLEIGIAIGEEYYNFGYKDLLAYFTAEGFASTSTAKIETYTKTKQYDTQGDNTDPPVDIDIIIELIHEKSTDPLDTFEGFLTEKEVMIYSGHARYGTGPDFDAKKSPAENFVIGVNSALHDAGKLKKGYNTEMNDILKGKANDLERLSAAGKFDPNLYQVWFFDTCKSINYLDEIRGGLVTDAAGKNKPDVDLRIFGTKELVYPDPLTLLKALLEMKTMEEIIELMEQAQEAEVKSRGEKVEKGGYFFAD